MGDEIELVFLLKEKDRMAFDALYNNYSSALYGAIIRIVEDEHIAQDVLQETFVKIWNKVDSYDNTKGKLYTWMLNIARNSAIDNLRGKGEIMRCKIMPDNETGHYFHDAVEQRTDRIGLRTLVSQLAPANQKIINLVYFEGYTLLQVSKILDTPLGSIKTHLRKSIASLRLNFA